MTVLFREHRIWEHINEKKIACYNCFELVDNGGFVVQSVDFYNLDKSLNSQIQYFQNQFIDLLLEDKPTDRNEIYPSLQSAIDAHKQEFGI